MTSAARKSGFTLLEVILAVGLSALLMALIAAGMRIYTQTVARRRADVVNAQVARAILQQISQDLKASYTSADSEASTDIAPEDETGTDETGTDTTTEDAGATDTTADLTNSTVQPSPGLFGNQSELQVDVQGRFTEPVRFDTLVAASVDAQAANLLSDPKVITYFLRALDGSELAQTPLQSMGNTGSQTVLVRRIASRAEAVYAATYGGLADNAGEQLLSDQIVVLQFIYFDGFDWVDSWDSTTNGGLPVAVSITLTVMDETADATDDYSTASVFEQTVYLPTAALPEATDTGI